VIGQVLGPQEAQFLLGFSIFPAPTQTHIFDNRSNGYGHLNTANVRSLAGH
jgi:hypothetical protein